MPTWNPAGPGNSDYSNPANWTGGVIPSSITDAIFDSASSNQNCNIDSAVIASSSCRDFITQNGYSGQINFNNWLSVNRNVTLGSGTFAGASGISLVGGTTAITTTVAYGGNLRIFRPTQSATTVTLANPLQVSSFSTGTSGGSGAQTDIVLAGLFNLSVSGNLTINHPIADTSTVTIIINGSGAQGWSGGAALGCNLTISKSAGTLSPTGTVNISNRSGTGKSFVWTSGSINWGTSVLSLSGHPSTVNPFLINYTSPDKIANLTLNAFNSNGQGTFSLLTNVDIVNFNHPVYVIVVNGFNLNVYGNFTHVGSSSGSTKYWIRGTGTINMSAQTTNDLEINSIGAVNAQSIVLGGQIGIGTTFTYTATASLTPGTVTVFSARNVVINPGSATFNNFRVGSADSNTPLVITLNQTMNCQDLSLLSTSFSASSVNINGSDINVSRDFINTVSVPFGGTTTVRFTGGIGTSIWNGGAYGVNFVINKAVSMTANPYNFSFFTSGKSIVVNTPLGSVNPGATSATINNGCALSFTRMRFYDLVVGTGAVTTAVNCSIDVTGSLLIDNTLTTRGTMTFTGNAGFTATNFVGSNVAAQTYTFRRGLTYTINGNFSFSGASSIARVTLQSDTRNDFTGTISGNQLTVTSGTAPIAGMRISQRSGMVPLQLAALYAGSYPYRPVVTGGAGPFTISPALASPITPAIALAGGIPAYITLGPAATQNVLFASTQDIDSFYGTPVFPSSSLPDSAGEPAPNLYRTVNWGVLAAPGLPQARTFCS